MTEKYEGKNWVLYNADCVEVLSQMPDNSVDFSVYSSPFSSLYVYSDSERDLGNAPTHDNFFEGFDFFARELFRVMKPGTVICDYVKDILFFQGTNETGESGIYPFSDKAIDAYRRAGFQLRSRTTIWTDPVRERTKTNADRLLHASIHENSRVCGTGMPEYILVMRKESKGRAVGEAVRHAVDTNRNKSMDELSVEVATEQMERLIRAGIIDGVDHDVLNQLIESCKFPVAQWSKWASPVWMDNATSDVLNKKFKGSEKDERHLTPTPLEYIRRVMKLYSNPGDVVLDPFSGIGSTGVVSLAMGRKFIGTELKPEYAAQAAKFIKQNEVQNLEFDF